MSIPRRLRGVLRRNAAVTARELSEGSGLLLLHTGTGAYHRLNRTGAMIWHALVEPAGLDELERRIRSDIGDPPPLADDLAAYVTELVGRDLIHVEQEEGPGSPA